MAGEEGRGVGLMGECSVDWRDWAGRSNLNDSGRAGHDRGCAAVSGLCWLIVE